METCFSYLEYIFKEEEEKVFNIFFSFLKINNLSTETTKIEYTERQEEYEDFFREENWTL